MKRYQHYFIRWEGHVKSAKLEGQQRAAVQDKIGVLEEKKTTLKDYTWLLQVLPPPPSNPPAPIPTYPPHLQSRSTCGLFSNDIRP